MKKILSERVLAAVLFVVAIIVFVFAQQDAEKAERIYISPGASASSVIPSPGQTASSVKPVTKKSEFDPSSFR